MNSSNASWQKGEVLIVEVRLTDTKTKTPISNTGTTVVIRLTKPNKSTVEPAVKEETDDEGTTWWIEQPLDEAGEWRGHVISSEEYATKRPFGPIIVGDD